jgi:hypothetical protein
MWVRGKNDPNVGAHVGVTFNQVVLSSATWLSSNPILSDLPSCGGWTVFCLSSDLSLNASGACENEQAPTHVSETPQPSKYSSHIRVPLSSIQLTRTHMYAKMSYLCRLPLKTHVGYKFFIGNATICPYDTNDYTKHIIWCDFKIGVPCDTLLTCHLVIASQLVWVFIEWYKWYEITCLV